MTEPFNNPKFSAFYKVVTPAPETTRVTDSQSLNDAGVYGNYSWYQRLVQGSGARLTRYREYDLMDNDVDVSRALDTIAEEICGNHEATDLPLMISYDAEDDSAISDTQVLTLRSALRHWVKIHSLKIRLFKIARIAIKYGDAFFYKKTEHARWEFIHPKHVVGAIVDRDDVTTIRAWQIRKYIKDSKSTYGVPLTTSSAQDNTEIIPADRMVRFTLNDDMSDTAPFGESVLRPVYRAHKQKELLEDSIVIYRIQRAPERRVFYIDVGKMPPARVKQYLEQVKNEIKQKKVPTVNGGADSVDSVYNPQSMSEDFFFAQRADGRGSRVDTLPGGQGLGELSDLEYFMDKVIRGLRIPYSYMYQEKEPSGAIFNDGRVGVAYIQELRFALYVQRLQQYFEEEIDTEFKKYLRVCNIVIKDEDWSVKLPEPQNFGKYRQQELDAALLNSFAQADQTEYMSKRFIMTRYLQLDESEIVRNEQLLREEKNLPPDEENLDPDLQTLYRPQDAMMMGDEMGGGPMGGGSPMTAGTLGGGPDALGGPEGAPGAEGGPEGGAEGGGEATPPTPSGAP
jgi:hypothetical protein